MTTLPTEAEIRPPRTVGEAIEDRVAVRNVVAELRGGSGEETLTLAGGVITPTVAAVAVDTEGQAATDDLTQIVQTNHPDGRELVIRAVDATRKIKARHLAGAAGEIELVAGRDILLNARHCIFLKRMGTRWVQMFETRPGGAVGEIGWTASATAPAGSLFCFGQLVNTADYFELFAEIGYTYGGSGAQFGLPDLRDRTAIGKGDMGGEAAGRMPTTGAGSPGIDTAVLGATGGVDRHQLLAAQLAQVTPTFTQGNHNHGYNEPGSQQVRGLGGLSANTTITSGTTGNAQADITMDAFGGDEAHPNVQPGIVLNAFIWT